MKALQASAGNTFNVRVAGIDPGVSKDVSPTEAEDFGNIANTISTINEALHRKNQFIEEEARIVDQSAGTEINSFIGIEQAVRDITSAVGEKNELIRQEG